MKIEIKKTQKPMDYIKSIKYLEKRVIEVIKGKKPELMWILEHKPIYTAGLNYKEYEVLNKSIKIIKTSRGGKITHHSPGQKIIYFVLDLNKRGRDIRKFVKSVERCIIYILKDYGIESFRDDKNIGIWVNKNNEIKKVAAIGIRVKRWIAYHGFCINIKNDLTVYNNIIPCGIKDKGVTNLISIKKKNYKKINQTIIKNFLKVFG